MLIILQNRVYNLSRFDTIFPTDGKIQYRIDFCRGEDREECAFYKTKDERDADWLRITSLIERSNYPFIGIDSGSPEGDQTVKATYKDGQLHINQEDQS